MYNFFKTIRKLNIYAQRFFYIVQLIPTVSSTHERETRSICPQHIISFIQFDTLDEKIKGNYWTYGPTNLYNPIPTYLPELNKSLAHGIFSHTTLMPTG
jgi:pullulanase/glycogen debranching enzyme